MISYNMDYYWSFGKLAGDNSKEVILEDMDVNYLFIISWMSINININLANITVVCYYYREMIATKRH